MGVTSGPICEGDLKNPTPLVPASQSEAPSSLPIAHGTLDVIACQSQSLRLLSQSVSSSPSPSPETIITILSAGHMTFATKTSFNNFYPYLFPVPQPSVTLPSLV